MVIELGAEKRPHLNIGPGEFIREEQESRGWRQEDLAEILGLSLKHVNQLIKNRQPITVDTARLLSQAFGQSAQYWMNLDANYRLRLQGQDEIEDAVRVRAQIYEHMPIAEMRRKRWLGECRKLDNLITQLQDFWDTDELDFHKLQIALPYLRKSTSFASYNEHFALTWFRMAQRCAAIYKVPAYDRSKLEALAANLHKFTSQSGGIELFLAELNLVGVKFFVLSHLQHTYIDGASFMDQENPVVVYTQRYDRIDNFWFTVAHEIGHILLHIKEKADFFIDNLDEIGSAKEKQANKLAAKYLGETEVLRCFRTAKKYISTDRVNSCAFQYRLDPAIVVGILQHHGMLSQRNLNRFKVKISGLIPDEYLAENHLERINESCVVGQ